MRRVIIITRRRRKKAIAPSWPLRQRAYYRRLGATLAERRLELLLTQLELAKAVHLSRASVANIEAGRQKLLIHQLADFAKALKLDAGGLLP
jgi:DNA-binding XRE family transcriptional regulator